MSNGLRQDSLSFKVCICGHPGVGKTAVLHRRITASFLTDYRPTVAAAFATVMESIDSSKVLLNIWDTAGQEKYQSMMPLYFRGVSLILLVVDVTSPPSWEFAKRWVDSELAGITPRPIVFVVANKADLGQDSRFASEVIEWTQRMRFQRYSTSAVTGSGVSELFMDVARALLEKRMDRRAPANDMFVRPTEDQDSCC
jgi:small GTP-binding protein